MPTGNELHARVLHALPMTVAVLDRSGRISVVNDSWHQFAIRNGAAEETARGVGLSYIDVCRRSAEADNEAKLALEGIEAVLAGKSPSFTLEYPCHSGDELRWFLMHAVTFGTSEHGGAVVSHFDITHRKLAEEALAQTSGLRAVGQLAGGIAHDFGNLLTIISGNLQLAEMHLEAGAALWHVRRALEAAERGATFNKRLVSLTDRRPGRPAPLVINEAVEHTARVLERMLGETIAIELRLAGDLWPASVDPCEIESGLLSLALNARDAMPGGGVLRISTSNLVLTAGIGAGANTADYVLLAVSDDGSGMAADVVARAAEPFFSTKDRSKSVGLGLTSVTRAVESAGGFITIDSAPGRGTWVSLHFPRSLKASELQAPAEGREAPDGGDQERILIVEDDPEVRDVVESRLRALGYGVLCAATAREAMAVLETEPEVRLVFSNVVMPGDKTGYDLVRWVRTHKPGVAVLLTSGYNQGDAAAGDRSAPDCELLMKPYSLAHLSASIRNALARR